MKKNNIIKVAALSSIGLMAISGGLINKEVKSAKAATETTVYYVISDSELSEAGADTVKLNVHLGGYDNDPWEHYVMTKSDKTYNTKAIYSYTFTDLYDGLGALQFQLCNGTTWIKQDQPISSWTTSSFYNGKMCLYGTTNWIDYAYDDPNFACGFYIIGTFNNGTYEVSNSSVLLTDSADKESYYSYEVKADVSLTFGDEFKIAYYGASQLSQWFGKSSLQNDGSAYCFGGTDNIKCYATGTYSIRLHNKPGEDKTIYVSINEEDGQSVAAYVMNYTAYSEESKASSTNGCSDRFYATRTKLLADSDALTEFQSYNPETFATTGNSELDTQLTRAYERYVSWAKVLNENPWASEAGYPSNKINGNSSISIDSNDSLSDDSIFYIILGIIGLTAVGGYFLINSKKKYSSK